MSITLQCGLSFIAGVLLGISLLYMVQRLHHRKDRARIKRELIDYYNSLIEDKTNAINLSDYDDLIWVNFVSSEGGGNEKD